jgi:hypothetical protein
MSNYMATVWFMMIILKAVWIFIVPVIIIIAACILWKSTPRWIPSLFLASAVVGFITSIPVLLMQMHKLTPQQYGEIAIPFAIAGGVVRIASAVALLALAISIKRKTEQNIRQVSSEGAPSAEPSM